MEREIKLIKLQLNLAGIELEFKRGKQSLAALIIQSALIHLWIEDIQSNKFINETTD